MKLSRDEKRQKASEIFNMIQECKTEDDVERVSDKLDDLEIAGWIFKKDYKFLCEELDAQISYLVGEGLI